MVLPPKKVVFKPDTGPKFLMVGQKCIAEFKSRAVSIESGFDDLLLVECQDGTIHTIKP